MNTVLQQEILRFNNLLVIIRNSMIQMRSAILGLTIMTQELEQVMNSLTFNKVPDLWHQNAYNSLKPLSSWVNDFLE